MSSSRATADMGPVTFDPAAIPLDAAERRSTSRPRSTASRTGATPPASATRTSCSSSTTRRRRASRSTVPASSIDERFPNRTNVEFVAVTGTDDLTMRVWERGVGETLSCGTRRAAAAAVAHRRGLVGDRVTVHVPGGDLVVELGATVRLGGPVVHVFDVDVDLARFGWNP